MPWTTDDVDKYHSGLSEEQKKKWVSIANSVLRTCVEKGGAESACAEKAIRTANARVDNQKQNKAVFSANMSKLVETKQFDGRDFYVVPVVLICEGVHNGVYYSCEELGNLAEGWNGRPVTRNHPVQVVSLDDGSEVEIPISANNPTVHEKQTIGKLFNVFFESPKLKGEAWIDIEKAKAVAPDVIELLEAEAQIEVSTGMFQFENSENGVWNNEDYSCVAHEIRPDHLAFLPDQKGACSWEDGGGAPRINAEKGGHGDPRFNEVDKKLNWLQSAIKKLLGNVQNQVQGEDMMDKEKIVQKLIAHEATKWTEDDTEMLMGLEESVLEALQPVVTDNAEQEEALNAKDAEIASLKAKIEELGKKEPAKTFEELAANASDEMKEAIDEMKRVRVERRNAFIETIKANEANPYTDEQLAQKATEELEGLAKLAGNASYEGRQVPRDNKDDDEDEGFAPIVDPFAK